MFNKIETWKLLERTFGPPNLSAFHEPAYNSTLAAAINTGTPIYSGAYIMPNPPFGSKHKHMNHLKLLRQMIKDHLPHQIAEAKSLSAVCALLVSYPSIGNFLAYQWAIDLNYSNIINFNEMDYVVAGPGARDGIRKCFYDTAGFSEEDVIRMVTDCADLQFDQLGLRFYSLWGRPLQLVDCQNLFCEVDKYARLAHPDVRVKGGRTRIKRRYSPTSESIYYEFPSGWRISAFEQPAEQPARLC